MTDLTRSWLLHNDSIFAVQKLGGQHYLPPPCLRACLPMLLWSLAKPGSVTFARRTHDRFFKVF